MTKLKAEARAVRVSAQEQTSWFSPCLTCAGSGRIRSRIQIRNAFSDFDLQMIGSMTDKVAFSLTRFVRVRTRQ